MGVDSIRTYALSKVAQRSSFYQREFSARPGVLGLIKKLIDSFGSHVIATVDLPKDSTIVSCPIELVITQNQSQRAVLKTLGINEQLEVNKNWTERQWISTYLSLHSIAEQENERYLSPG